MKKNLFIIFIITNSFCLYPQADNNIEIQDNESNKNDTSNVTHQSIPTANSDNNFSFESNSIKEEPTEPNTNDSINDTYDNKNVLETQPTYILNDSNFIYKDIANKNTKRQKNQINTNLPNTNHKNQINTNQPNTNQKNQINTNQPNTNMITTNYEPKDNTTSESIPKYTTVVNEADLQNIEIKTATRPPTKSDNQEKIPDDNNYKSEDSQTYLAKNIHIENPKKNETKCFIIDNSERESLGHFLFIKELDVNNSFNNITFTDVYYVVDNAIKQLQGLVNPQDVGLMCVYYKKFMTSFGLLIFTSILDTIILGGAAALIAISFMQYASEYRNNFDNFFNNLFNNGINKDKDFYYGPLFVGGLGLASFGLILAIVVIANAIIATKHYNTYYGFKRNVINSLNNIRTPISIKDSDGDSILKIGFDFRVN